MPGFALPGAAIVLLFLAGCSSPWTITERRPGLYEVWFETYLSPPIAKEHLRRKAAELCGGERNFFLTGTSVQTDWEVSGNSRMFSGGSYTEAVTMVNCTPGGVEPQKAKPRITIDGEEVDPETLPEELKDALEGE